MEIGRTPLTDAEFNILWGKLYKEFFELSTTGVCDASEVYNTIYRVCTSTLPYEDKLYWKIGDFLYNRCKEHKSRIDVAGDYIRAYAESFEAYEHMVRAIDKLGGFLNECVRGRRIDEFGYLLWERSIIQMLPKSFFEDVYNYDYKGNFKDIYKGNFKDIYKEDRHVIGGREIESNDRGVEAGNGLLRYLIKVPQESETGITVVPYRNGHDDACVSLRDTYDQYLEGCNQQNKGIRYGNKRTIRRVILESFSCIIPDPFNPMLYYREKYEKMALMKLEEKYRMVYDIEDVVAYSEMFYKVAVEEGRMSHDYFLPESREKYERVLADCLLCNEDGVVMRIKEYMKSIIYNGEYGREIEGCWKGEDIVRYGDIQMIMSPLIQKKNRKLREYFNSEEIYMNGNAVKNIVRSLGVFSRGYSVVKKGYAMFVVDMLNGCECILGGSIYGIYRFYRMLDIFNTDSNGYTNNGYFNNDFNNYTNNSNSNNYTINNDYTNNNRIINNTVSYANDNAINNTINNSKQINFKDNCRMESYDLLIQEDFNEILLVIIRFALQRIKPCFITRICIEVGRYVSGDNNNGNSSFGNTFNHFPLTFIIELVYELVTDKTEFTNIYQSYLKVRLLQRRSCLKKEKEILRILNMDIKLQKMIEDIEGSMITIIDSSIISSYNNNPSTLNNNPNTLNNNPSTLNNNLITSNNSFITLTPIYWNIDSNSSDCLDLKLPEILLRNIINSHGGFIKDHCYRKGDRSIKTFHKYSRVKININNKIISTSLCQYVIINAIQYVRKYNEILDMTGIKDSILNTSLELLIEKKAIIKNNNEYFISKNIGTIEDISGDDDESKIEKSFCMISYMQGIIAKIMKRKKLESIKEIEIEIKKISRIEVNSIVISQGIDVLIEKGIIERNEDGLIEYVN